MLAQIGLVAWEPVEVLLPDLHQADADLAPLRRVHQRPVEFPEVWRNPAGDLGADLVEELLAKARFADGGLELPAPLRRRLSPIRLHALVFRPERILVDVTVLDDQPGDALRCAPGELHPDPGAVIVQIQREALQAETVGEVLQQARIAFVVVAEPVRRGAVAEARIIRRNQPPAVCESRQQVAELIGRTGIAVRQEQRRRVARPRLAIEDLDAADLDGGMADRRLATASAHCVLHVAAPFPTAEETHGGHVGSPEWPARLEFAMEPAA